MRVRLTLLADAVGVELLGAGGSGANHVVVKPGQQWRGFRYPELRELGDGEHQISGSTPSITLRGYK